MGASRVGKTLGNFRILECLGSGGAGMIWKAEDASLGRIVALKALRPELAADGEMAERFRVEARTLAKLSHANVASLYSLIEDDEGIFLVLEYVEGNTLAALLATSGPLPLDSAFALFHQVLDGVGHAHEAGVVHRDLKPANLMVDARGRVKVMDFGIARMAGAARTTHHGKLVGTPEYMSPEQVRGEDATIRSDIYALGILLFEMLTGQPPFRATASFELMRAQIEDPPPDPRSLRPEIDARVAAALLRALAKRPAERFASTRELQDALLDAGASRRGHAVAPVWRDVPPAVATSEPPTLPAGDALDLARAPSAPARAAAPAPANSGETLEIWKQAVDALDQDIDAALAAEDAAPLDHAERARAPATVVLDASQDTSVLEPARPTRMLEDAPFATHARALGAKPARGAEARRPPGWAWAVAAAALLALAIGVVKLRARDDAVAGAGAAPEARAPAQTEPPRAPGETARASATRPLGSAASRPEREPARAIAAPPAPAASAAPQPKKPAAPRRDRNEPAAPAQEESGWVIRR